MQRRSKGRERAEAVVNAAGLAIAELGFANVRVADIAARAAMTPGHVTYYFPSKPDLLLLALRRSEERLVAESRDRLAAIDDPVERLRDLIAAAAAERVQDDGWNLWLQVWASGQSDSDVSAGHREHDERWFGLLTEVVEHGRATGAFRVDDVAAVAEIVAAIIDGLSIQLTVGSARLDRDRLLRLAEQGSLAVLGATST